MKYTSKILLLIAAVTTWSLSSSAQIVIDNPDSQQEDDEKTEVSTEQSPTILLTEDDLPEGMQDSEVDSMLSAWMVKNHLTFDEQCDPSTVNPEFTKEEYIDRLNRLPVVIERPYNDIVRSYIDRYAARMRRSVSMLLGASNFYNPIFEEALDSYQLPLELKYLPIIESALNPKATSSAGAGGLWQFIVSTAKHYNLEVNSLIDERCDPVKSSYAAARCLRDFYNIFGDWTLCLAAYNCGPGNVKKAMKRAGGSKDYWELYPYLPRETRGYVPAFIAAMYIMNYYCDHNICPVETKLPLGCDTIMINRKLSMQQVANVTGMSMDELKALNPQYRTNIIPGHSLPCTLKLPPTAISAFLEAGDSVYTYRANEYFTNRSEAAPAGTSSSSSSTKMGNSSRTSKKTAATQTPSAPANSAAVASEVAVPSAAATTASSAATTSSKSTKSNASATTATTTASSKNSGTNTSSKNSQPSRYSGSSNATTSSKTATASTTAASSKNATATASATTASSKNATATASSKTANTKSNSRNGKNDGSDTASTTASSKKSSKTAAAETRKQSSKNVTVTVKKGDTLSDIAKKNGTTVAELKKANGITGDNIRVGQNIKVK